MPLSPEADRRSLDDLVSGGLLDAQAAADLGPVAAAYPVTLTATLAAAIDPMDPGDPIARQFVPSLAELLAAPEELADPIADDAFSPLKGIVHRHADRLLLKPVHVCPVYCRFCFRREMVGPGAKALTAAELAAALDYIRRHEEVWEVILTGGDPLMLSPRRLAGLIAALDAIPHVAVIRLHTRVPVAAPERVSAALIAALATADAALYIAVHCNHARELGDAARAACARLSGAGIPLLGQSVLLRGVNDDEASLTALMRALVKARIKPYYLHQGDLAPGTAHFRTTITEGQALMRHLRANASGLCQPHYVLDIPGGHGKVPIGPAYLAPGPEGGYEVTDLAGNRHAYPPAPADAATSGAPAVLDDDGRVLRSSPEGSGVR